MADGFAEIGTVSFFVNDPKGYALSDDEAQMIGVLVAEHYAQRLAKSPLEGVVIVSAFETRRGCLIVTLTLAAKLVAGRVTVGAVTKFLKDYEDIRKGAILLAKDLNNLRLKLNQWSKEHTVWFYRDDIEYKRAKRRLDDEKRDESGRNDG